MKKFMLLACALFSLAVQAHDSTFSVEIRYAGYEGDNFRVTTINNLNTGCDMNDMSNSFLIKPSGLQKVWAGILMSAHQNKKFATILYDRTTCSADGVTVVGAAIDDDVVKPVDNYQILKQDNLKNRTQLVNNTGTAQRLILSGYWAGGNTGFCNVYYKVNDTERTTTSHFLSQDGSGCILSQSSFEIPAGGWFQFDSYAPNGQLDSSSIGYTLFGVPVPETPEEGA